MQWYPDFGPTTHHTSLEEIRDRTGDDPGRRLPIADLAGILPRAIHAAFYSVFEDLMAAFVDPLAKARRVFLTPPR